VGDGVLVLLPASSHKLEMWWQASRNSPSKLQVNYAKSEEEIQSVSHQPSVEIPEEITRNFDDSH